MRKAHGVLVTAAAGNDNAVTPQYPAAYPGVVAVTALDEANHKADFANYGADWIDLAAPGVSITSTIPVSGSILYATWSGTSMAVPFVSGAAALLRQQFPTAQPSQVADLLVQTGMSLDSYNPGYAWTIGPPGRHWCRDAGNAAATTANGDTDVNTDGNTDGDTDRNTDGDTDRNTNGDTDVDEHQRRHRRRHPQRHRYRILHSHRHPPRRR